MSYTVKEAADKLNVSKPTIRKYLNKLSADDVVDNHIDDEKGTLIISQRCFEALLYIPFRKPHLHGLEPHKKRLQNRTFSG